MKFLSGPTPSRSKATKSGQFCLFGLGYQLFVLVRSLFMYVKQVAIFGFMVPFFPGMEIE